MDQLTQLEVNVKCHHNFQEYQWLCEPEVAATHLEQIIESFIVREVSLFSLYLVSMQLLLQYKREITAPIIVSG